MKKNIRKGLRALYAEDPLEADKLIWGRESDPRSRRGFLKNGALAFMGTILGARIVFADHMPAGLIPAGILETDDPFPIKGKHPGLTILNDRPWNVETPAHLLDDAITPADRMFIRNNGLPPENVDTATWTLEIAGESVRTPKTYTLAELKQRFSHHTYQLVLECGGNGRAEFNPPAKGNQWTTGAVSCSAWTGVLLRDVLEDAGLKDDAVYIGYYGRDTHLSGDPDKVVISRGVPIAKALQDESLIAWAVNGEDIPLMNGHPLRLVFGGWPASTSGKWLAKIVVRNQVHDGPKMTGQSYRVPCKPVAPGTEVADEDMCIIESMPVKSVITSPKNGGILQGRRELKVRGKAWAGERAVARMEVSIDFGATWQVVSLQAPANRLAWQLWEGNVRFPEKGYYEIWARATDTEGIAQPMVLPGWNPRGYLNNACHRIAIKVV
ncbi:MAG: molybdopterin containing oxidoreductase [Bacteroidetes bacterium]|nr:MAG: molybdopterin containing oxidoreductase [Bacteroidota bacterium]